MNITKQTLIKRILLIIITTPLVFLLLGSIALYIPWVQDQAVRYATTRASESLGVEVQIGRLRLGFPARIELEELVLLPKPTDTLVHLEHLELSLSLRPLFSSQVVVPKLVATGIKLSQMDSLGLTHTQLRLDRASVESVGVDLDAQHVRLGLIYTEGGRIRYVSRDTTASEASEPILWTLRADQIKLVDTQLDVQMPLDSIYLSADAELFDLQRGGLDLGAMKVSLEHARLEASRLTYSVDTAAGSELPYLDPSHVALMELELQLSDLHYHGDDVSLQIQQGKFRERSGFALTALEGEYRMDSLALALTALSLQTEHSAIYGDVQIPWALMEEDEHAQFYTILDGAFGAEDVRTLTGRSLLGVGEAASYEEVLAQAQMTGPIDFALHLHGSLDSLWIDQVQLVWDGVMNMSVQGSLTKVNKPEYRRGNLTLEGGLQTQASTLIAVASPEIARDYSLPAGLTFKGTLGFGGGRDLLALRVRQNEGVLDIRGSYDELAERYELQAKADHIDLSRYIRNTQMGVLSVEIDVKGRGLDWRSRRTYSEAKLRLQGLDYAGKRLENITLDGSLHSGALSVALNSFNPGFNLAMQLDGLITKEGIYSSILLDNQEIDLQRWGMADLPLSVRGRLTGELRSDLAQTHSFTAMAEQMHLVLSGREIRPNEVSLELKTTPAYAEAHLHSGDLALDAHVGAGPDALVQLSERLPNLLGEAMRQVEQPQPMTLRLEELIAAMPALQASFSMGSDNALRPYLAEQRIAIGKVSTRLELSAERGLTGAFEARDIRQDTLRLSSIDLEMNTQRVPRLTPEGLDSLPRRKAKAMALDSMSIAVNYSVVREPYRAEEGLTLQGTLRTSLQEALVDITWLDQLGRMRHQMALAAAWSGESYQLRLPQEQLLLAYQPLKVNEDNSIVLDKATLGVDSKLILRGEGRTLLSLLAAQQAEPRQQQAEVMVQHLNLEDFRALGLPNIGGTVFADVRYDRQGDFEAQPVITGDVSAQRLRYEDKQLGHFASALFYEPRTDRSHYITAEVSYEGNQALSLDAIYYPEDEASQLSGKLSLNGMPLEVANPFLQSYATSLAGKVTGELSIRGALSKPLLEGSIRGEQAQVSLEQYASVLELDSLPLRFEDNALHFDHYAVRSKIDRNKPLYIDGYVQVFGDGPQRADLRFKADDMTILDQPNPRTEKQLLYGKLIVSTDMGLSGELDALKVRGRLSVQGGTNCIYVMREGGLESTNKMNDLLSFVDFADTLFAREPVVDSRLGGLDVSLALHFDPSVRFGVDLTADGTDYMRIQGGGDMQFSYPPYGEMKLIGRYNMNGGGQLHYTIPVVGGKLFDIDPSGYLRFTGDVVNPYINFRATQKVKATVGKSTKKTNFLVSIEAKDHVEDIKLTFDLDAPEELSVQNALTTMTPEERGKQAIGLMATGIYLAGGGSGAKMSFDSALSSLLQSQINKAAGTLLRGTDINIGMEMHDGSSGAAYTDYTYSFSRRFYNDRIRVVVGGKIQSGNVPSNQEQTLIDNVALEYQLDKAGEQYLRLYHKRITDNVLEGEHTETGAGYLIKRKLNRPADLFRFRLAPPSSPTVRPTVVGQPWQAALQGASADSIATERKNNDSK